MANGLTNRARGSLGAMPAERLTLLIPETLNNGSPVAGEQFEEYECSLLEIAFLAKELSGLGEEGFTLSHVIGAWRSPSGEMFREPLRRYEIDVAATRLVMDEICQLADRVRGELAQEVLYVTVSPVDAMRVTEYVAT